MPRIVVHWLVPAQMPGFRARAACGVERPLCSSDAIPDVSCPDCRRFVVHGDAVDAVLASEWAQLERERRALLVATSSIEHSNVTLGELRSYRLAIERHMARSRECKLWLRSNGRYVVHGLTRR
jgi:hypothetical protein